VGKVKKICFITAIDGTIKAFMINHLRELSKMYEITIITNTDDKNFLKSYNINNINNKNNKK
jgi:ABC-type dipeptide/oligopeptide/nickel transport system ATPase subunit